MNPSYEQLVFTLTALMTNISDDEDNVEAFRQALTSLGIQLPVLEYRSSVALLGVKGSEQRGLLDVRRPGRGPARLHTLL